MCTYEVRHLSHTMREHRTVSEGNEGLCPTLLVQSMNFMTMKHTIHVNLSFLKNNFINNDHVIGKYDGHCTAQPCTGDCTVKVLSNWSECHFLPSQSELWAGEQASQGPFWGPDSASQCCHTLLEPTHTPCIMFQPRKNWKEKMGVHIHTCAQLTSYRPESHMMMSGKGDVNPF